MTKQDFVSLCIAGLASPAEIDEYVERWHKGQAGAQQQLGDYLGMNLDEYAAWVADPEYLYAIIAARAQPAK
ncbi:hypothetical protein ACHMW6_29055 [Pseudoduganella sp. UC29_106]|uniref:hypothetical protein n=1 Tax=Pseudoduganella sp. UC29_106 TaxID=3374553 RepID=UPI0037581168